MNILGISAGFHDAGISLIAINNFLIQGFAFTARAYFLGRKCHTWNQC